MSNSCTCDICKGMCKSPCFPTPPEAQAIIDAGHSGKLQFLRWWQGLSEDYVAILRPAHSGREGTMVAEFEHFDLHDTKCTFQDAEGLCTLHDKGLKPGEGREVIHGNSEESPAIRLKYVETWDNPEARAQVSAWRSERGL